MNTKRSYTYQKLITGIVDSVSGDVNYGQSKEKARQEHIQGKIIFNVIFFGFWVVAVVLCLLGV